MTRRPRWHGFLRDNSLTLVFMVTFLMVLAGQALAAHRLYNEEQLEHHEHAVGLLDFLTSSRFAVEVTENWQSEFLEVDCARDPRKRSARGRIRTGDLRSSPRSADLLPFDRPRRRRADGGAYREIASSS